MATTSLWRINGPIGNVLRYAENPDKTKEKPKDGEERVRAPTGPIGTDNSLSQVIAYAERDNATNQRQFVTGLNCSPERAMYEMNAVKRAFGKEGGTIAYHGYQSFKEGEVTPEEAHQIGIKLADELWGDRYQVLVATHLDKESHIHTHFVINTVSFIDGKKFHRTKEDYRQMQKVSDRLCREYHLSVIEEPSGKGKHYSEWLAEENGKPTYRSMIRKDIDRAIKASLTEQQFFRFLQDAGYEFKFYSKTGEPIERPSLKPQSSERFFRFDRLGEDYSLEEIRERILENDRRMLPFTEEDLKEIYRYRAEHPPKVKHKGIAGLYYYYCYLLKIMVNYSKVTRRLSSAAREDLLKLERLDQEVRLLAENHIESREDLERFMTDVADGMEVVTLHRNQLRNQLRTAVRREDNDAAEGLRKEIADDTEKLQSLRKMIKTAERIVRRMDEVQVAVKALDGQPDDGEEHQEDKKKKAVETPIFLDTRR